MTLNDTSVSVRRAGSADAASLAALGAATFTETFGHLYPPEDLHGFLTTTHSIDTWDRVLRDPQRAVWFATLPDATPIGYLSVGACKLPVENLDPNAGEIQQLY